MNPFNLFRYVPLPFLKGLALFVAWIINCLPNLSIRRTIDINLRLAYPELNKQTRKILSADIIRNQCLTSVESLKCWAMPPQWSIAKIKNVHNKEVFLQALNSPKGMLAIVPHLGTWEMMNAWLNQHGSPTIMYKPIKHKLGNAFVLQGREKLNSTLVPTDASGVKAIFKTLKAGGFSIILPDHVPHPSGGVIAPFFDINTLSSTLAPKLASKTKCALVGLVCLRNNDAKTNCKQSGFDIHCVALDDPALYDKDMVVATTALNKAMETMINTCPSHYMWGYRRFKNLPVINNPYELSESEFQKYLELRANSHDN